MTDRDRLEKLYEKATEEYAKTNKALFKKTFICDYLLANGVIVPIRCKDCEFYTHIIQASAKWKSKTFYCTRNVNMKMNENDYCSCAKLKELKNNG